MQLKRLIALTMVALALVGTAACGSKKDEDNNQQPGNVEEGPTGGGDTPGGGDAPGGGDVPGGGDTPGGGDVSGGGDTPGENPNKTLTYDDLITKGNIVINNDFETAMTIEDYTDKNGIKGIYQGFSIKSGAGSKDTNNVTVEAGKALLNDASNGGTQLYVDLGGKLDNGLIEMAFDINLKNSANSWTPVQVIGSDGTRTNSEIFALRTNNNNIEYRIGSNGSATAAESTIARDDVNYKIHMIVDIENNKFTMTINDQAFLTNKEFGIKNISCIKFTSSDGDFRTLDIDSLVVRQDAIETSAYIVKLTNELDAYVSGLDQTKYTINADALAQALATAKASVSVATSNEDARVIYDQQLALIKEVKNDDEQALQNKIEENVLAFIAYKDAANYTTTDADGALGNVNAYNEALANGEALIRTATTIEEANIMLNDAKALLDAIPTDADLAKTPEELQSEAKAEINLYLVENNIVIDSIINNQEKAYIKDLYDNAILAIDAASDAISISQLKADAIADIASAFGSGLTPVEITFNDETKLVEWAAAEGQKYDVYVNDIFVKTVNDGSYKLVASADGDYIVKVIAKQNGKFDSNDSNIVTLTATGTVENKTLNADIANFAQISSTAGSTGTLAFVDSDYEMTIKNVNVSGSTRYNNGVLEMQCKVANAEYEYKFTTLGNSTVNITVSTGGGSKYMYYKIDGVANDSYKVANSSVTINLVGAGEHTITFYSVAQPGSNWKISSFNINTDVYTANVSLKA